MKQQSANIVVQCVGDPSGPIEINIARAMKLPASLEGIVAQVETLLATEAARYRGINVACGETQAASPPEFTPLVCRLAALTREFRERGVAAVEAGGYSDRDEAYDVCAQRIRDVCREHMDALKRHLTKGGHV